VSIEVIDDESDVIEDEEGSIQVNGYGF